MSKVRIESFSDGVIAVAITLLALNLHVPDPHAATSLAHRLAAQWPNYLAYVISFATIGIIWVNHHAMLARLVTVDHTILVLNLLLLMTIGVLPFSTALMAEYLRAPHGGHLAACVYGGSYLAMTLSFFAIQRNVLVAKHDLLRPDLTPAIRTDLLRRNATGLGTYTIATLLGIVSPYLTLAICGVVAAFYALPDRTAAAETPATGTGAGEPDDG